MLMVYVNAMGGKLRFGILLSWFVLVELCRVGATVWLSYWTGNADKPGMNNKKNYLGLLVLFVTGLCCVCVVS